MRNDGATLEYDIDFASHRPNLVPGPRPYAVSQSTGESLGEYYVEGVRWHEDKSGFVLYGVLEAASSAEAMCGLLKEVKDDKLVITVSPGRPLVGKPPMALWFPGSEPCLEIPNRMDYALGEVFDVYERVPARLSCPVNESREDYAFSAAAQHKKTGQVKLVNYGIIQLPGVKTASGTRDLDLYTEDGDWRGSMPEDFVESSDVWVETMWYEFAVVEKTT